MMNKKIRLQTLVSMALILIGFSAQAQSPSNVTARFSNPQYDVELNIYTVDVELKSTEAVEYLFGFNVRFFYDAETMEFQKLTDFANGYGILGREPAPFVGHSTSGRELFSMSGAAAYVNTGVQLLQEESKALSLSKEEWSRAFRVEFKLKNFVDKDRLFCPSIIWDLKDPNRSTGGIMSNGDGIVFTLLDKESAKKGDSYYSYSSAHAFNWEYTNREELPYGIPVAETCLNLSLATSVPSSLYQQYKVFQNQPNPFDDQTFISFSIPSPAKVKLRVMDAAGKILLEQIGDYNAGNHAIRIENSGPLADASQILFYQISTEEYLSPTFKMNRIKN